MKDIKKKNNDDGFADADKEEAEQLDKRES